VYYCKNFVHSQQAPAIFLLDAVPPPGNRVHSTCFNLCAASRIRARAREPSPVEVRRTNPSGPQVDSKTCLTQREDRRARSSGSRGRLSRINPLNKINSNNMITTPKVSNLNHDSNTNCHRIHAETTLPLAWQLPGNDEDRQ